MRLVASTIMKDMMGVLISWSCNKGVVAIAEHAVTERAIFGCFL